MSESLEQEGFYSVRYSVALIGNSLAAASPLNPVASPVYYWKPGRR